MAEAPKLVIKTVINDMLSAIPKEREREIIARRFGLFDRKETLEQIGEVLGITRERVRQLEKAVLNNLKSQAADKKLPHITEIEDSFVALLKETGNIARISDLTAQLTKDNSRSDQARVSFLAQLCPKLVVIDENDTYHLSIAVKGQQDEKSIKKQVGVVIDAVKAIGEPTNIEKIAEQAGYSDPAHVQALASTSKRLATLHGVWGLTSWPTVNPKNIRDKIYVILQQQGSHMHFSEIAAAIKESSFKRKEVTTQAIHNELIKDKRFVLIGRGLYALKEWGYSTGTVSDIIEEVLRKAGEPLHRDEIVQQVLKSRHVKETTILLNLQSKPRFKRTAKATYTLAS